MSVKTPEIITLQDIADRLGLSRSTVSLALRNDPRLSAATRSSVVEAARALGYRPNPMVSALMRQQRARRATPRFPVLAYLTAFPAREKWREWAIFRDYWAGAESRALQLGYRLEEFWLGQAGMDAARMSVILYTRSVVGVIVAPLPVDRGALEMDWSHFAAISIGYTLVDPPLDRVEAHLFRAMLTAVRQVRERGYRRIGLALPSYDNERADYEWVGGYEAATCGDATHLPVLLVRGDQWNIATFAAWFRETRPQVVLSIQAEVVRWLAKLGKRVPGDVGFVNLNCPSGDGVFSGIYQNGQAVGSLALDLLAGMVERNEYGIPPLPRTHLVEGTWIEGATVRPIKAGTTSRGFPGPATAGRRTPLARHGRRRTRPRNSRSEKSPETDAARPAN